MIPDDVKKLIELSSKSNLPSKEYTRIAFALNGFLLTLEREWHTKKQEINRMIADEFNAQEKKNQAAAETKVKSTDAYREMEDLESEVGHIKRAVGIAREAEGFL